MPLWWVGVNLGHGVCGIDLRSHVESLRICDMERTR